MTDTAPPRADRVEETLVLPVWSRAVEDSRSKALFRDPTATRLWRALGRDDAAFLKDYSGRLGIVLRTLKFDAWTRAFLDEHPDGTVVEAGVGLNTR
ncbi:MAG: class I SAM-dependent methyltransferase, partial [Planctomycetota bacterium]